MKGKPSELFLYCAIIVLTINVIMIVLAHYMMDVITYIMGITTGGTLIFVYMKLEQLGINWNDHIKIIKLVKIIDIIKEPGDKET